MRMSVRSPVQWGGWKSAGRQVHTTALLVAMAPSVAVARKTTVVPLGALMDLAHEPQLCFVRGCQAPPLSCASTPAKAWFALTSTSIHQSLPTAFGLNAAEKSLVVVVLVDVVVVVADVVVVAELDVVVVDDVVPVMDVVDPVDDVVVPVADVVVPVADVVVVLEPPQSTITASWPEGGIHCLQWLRSVAPLVEVARSCTMVPCTMW
jgi:hypothetical protein